MAGPATRGARLRKLLPWIIGVALLIAIAARVPFDQFRTSIGHGPHLALAAVEIAIVIVVLGTDSVSTWIGMLALRIRWPLRKVIALRGATYLLFMINYAVGQGGFGYYLYRAGEPPLRAVGATLFLLGTTLAALLLLTFGVSAVAGGGPASLWWTLVAGVSALGLYLVAIAIRPAFLARRQVLAPLFEAGIRGHATAIAGRLPHMLVIVWSYWVAMRVWGIDVPVQVAAVLMPAVVLATVLPISPAGLGTTQAAMIYLFGQYAPGATADEREAALLAFGIVHFVYSVVAALAVGFLCLPFARRSGAIPAAQAQAQAQAQERKAARG